MCKAVTLLLVVLVCGGAWQRLLVRRRPERLAGGLSAPHREVVRGAGRLCSGSSRRSPISP
jgi:hypothetical protein